MPNDTKVTIDFSIRQNPKFENLKNLKNFPRTRISYSKLTHRPSKIVSRFSNFPEGFSRRVSIRFLFHFHKNVYKYCDDR